MNTKVERDDTVVTVAQAAQNLGCSKMTIYRWADSGNIGSRIIGGKLFILKDEVERLKTARAPQGRKLSASGDD